MHAHIFGDFGTRGLPGTFKLMLVDCIVQMARSEMVLTLPMTIYVDDGALIGPDKEKTDLEMKLFQSWSSLICGIVWKRSKDKEAACPQLYIGFWWDSRLLTRTLDEKKLVKYLNALLVAASARSLTLKERQSLAGWMQRAIMTFPPGAACLLVNCYQMMAGLLWPWQQRRTTRGERQDYRFVHDLLELNLGKGYYSYDGFGQHPGLTSDASKSKAYAGGGYVEATGFYDFFAYGSSAARKPIDFLEGDVVVRACAERGRHWRGMLVPFGIDNTAFQLSADRGRSKAERLNALLRILFALQLQEGFILQTYWLSTHANYLSDDLSRNREDAFLARVFDSGFLAEGVTQLQRHPKAGRVVHLPDVNPSHGMSALRQLLDCYRSNNLKDGPSRGPGVGGDAQLLSLSYSQCTIFDGLPIEYVDRADQILDNRLAPSSRDKMMTGYRRWAAHCEAEGWSPLILSGDLERGGKMASWVISMVDDTNLVYGSISTYVWGMCVWQELQHQDDPRFGVKRWRQFMFGAAVLAAVPGEPRRRFPLKVIEALLNSLDRSNFREAQLGLLVLVLLFTFSRTECPCPKSWSGRDTFDPAQHWTANDFKLKQAPNGMLVLWIRFKGIKQDPRIERPGASEAVDWLPFETESDGKGRDWVPIGDVGEDSIFSVSLWYKAVVRALARERTGDEPMFLALDKQRPYTYSCLRADMKHYLGRAGLDDSNTPHGLRVEGYNLSRDGNGIDLTVAHGGWFSEGHSRYARFRQLEVLGIPKGMLGLLSSESPRAIERSRLRRNSELDVAATLLDEDSGASDDGIAAAEPDSQSDLLPDGFQSERRVTPTGRVYFLYSAPDGAVLRSRVACFAYESNGPSRPRPPSPGSRRSEPRRPRTRQATPSTPSATAEAGPLCVEIDSRQCGNPNCIVRCDPGANNEHPGLCRFPDPPPRRRAA